MCLASLAYVPVSLLFAAVIYNYRFDRLATEKIEESPFSVASAEERAGMVRPDIKSGRERTTKHSEVARWATER